LGVTGEVGEYDAIALLKLKYAPVREAGFDAVDARGNKYQIKARVCGTNGKYGRMGSIKIKYQWDFVVLVLLNAKYRPVKIYQAPRTKVCAALTKPGSKARNERGALSVSQFLSISSQVWP
jgi:hypothetical protein